MQDLFKDAAVEVAELLKRFSFDLDGLTAEQLVPSWLAQYPANWVRLSLVEALYQGRYKAVSVEQILRFWQRRGQPFYHFNYEFERIIRGRFSRNLLAYSTAVSPPVQAQTGQAQTSQAQTSQAQTSQAQTGVPAECNASSQPGGSESIRNEEIKDTQETRDDNPEISELEGSLSFPESPEPEDFSAIVDAVSVVSATSPSSDEAAADLLIFTDPVAPTAPAAPATESAIQPFSDRLKILSSEESIAFLKLRSFENDTPFDFSPKDSPIQAFTISEPDAADKPKWAKLAIESSTDESSTEQIQL